MNMDVVPWKGAGTSIQSEILVINIWLIPDDDICDIEADNVDSRIGLLPGGIKIVS